MSRRSLLWVCSLGFLIGIFLASYTGFGLAFGAFTLLLALCTIVLTHEHYAVLTFCVLVGMSLGIFRFEWATRKSDLMPSRSLTSINSFVGDVIEEPKETESGVQYVVRLPATSSTSVIKVQVATYTPANIEYGDRVKIQGKIVRVESEKAPDYWKTHLKTKGIAYEIKQAQLEKLEGGHGNPIIARLLGVKLFILSRIQRSVPEPESALLGGILLGARTTLGKELSDQFNKVGISHIVALSGYNITIIATWLQRALKFLPFSYGIFSSGVAILLFILMTGASASAVRAGIMALILLLARKEGRTYDAGTALVAAAVLMVLVNPYILMNDFGFQLSFLASVGIVYLLPILLAKTVRTPDFWMLKEILLGTIAAEAMVMPLIIYKTGVLSLISLVSNLLILPAVPPLMGLGFILIILATVSHYLVLPMAWLAYLLLSYIITTVRVLYTIPYAFVTVAYLSFVPVILWYMVMFWVMVKYSDAEKHSST